MALSFFLGVLKKYAGSFTSTTDLDSKPQGYWNANEPSNLPLNSPEKASYHFFGVGGGDDNSWGIQLVFPTNKSYFYFRTHFSTSFTSWFKVQGAT